MRIKISAAIEKERGLPLEAGSTWRRAGAARGVCNSLEYAVLSVNSHFWLNVGVAVLIVYVKFPAEHDARIRFELCDVTSWQN